MSKDLKIAINRALNIVALECDDDQGYIRNLVEGAWQGEAETQLAKLGDAVMPSLIKALTTYDNSRVVCFIAKYLANRKVVAAVKPLIKILLNQNHNDNVRQTAAKALGEIGDVKAVNALIKALKEPATEYNAKYMRGSAAQALGKIGDKKALKPLIKFAADQAVSSLLRNDAIEALAQFADEQVLKLLFKTLQDKNDQVREASARALGEMKNILAFDHLIKMLDDKYSLARRQAIRSLFKLDKLSTIDLLLTKVEEEKDSYVLTNIIELLGEAKDLRATTPLLKLLGHSNSDIIVASAKTLATIGAKEAVQPLCQLLSNHNSSYVRWNIAEALGNLMHRDAIATLINALRDKDTSVRMQATIALAKLPDKSAIAPLIDGLRKRDNYKQPMLMAYQVSDALISIGADTIEPLLEILKIDSDDEIVKGCALVVLKQLGYHQNFN